MALKSSNLAALDTSIRQKGMANASKLDKRIWEEFLSNPNGVIEAYKQQEIAVRLPAGGLGDYQQPRGMSEPSVDFDLSRSGERVVETTQRIGQEFFRKIILTSYRERCALTGIEDKRLLNASHIVPWKDDVENRINPSNGICLNALHDRAFDRYLITFDEDYRMKMASHVPNTAKKELERIETGRLELPNRFLPDQSFLEQHRRIFYEKSQGNSI